LLLPPEDRRTVVLEIFAQLYGFAFFILKDRIKRKLLTKFLLDADFL